MKAYRKIEHLIWNRMWFKFGWRSRNRSYYYRWDWWADQNWKRLSKRLANRLETTEGNNE